MNDDNVKTQYQIVLNDELSDVEVARLREVQTMYGLKHTEFSRCTIRLEADVEDHEVFGGISTWLSYIGAECDIFCIQRITSYYTNMTSPAIKDLMRT